MYNKKVYEELGLTVPKTWDELLANCEKIKEAGKTPVIGAYASPGWAQLILLSDFYNVQAQMPDFAAKYSANKANFAETPIALRGFEKLYEIGEKGYFNEDFLAATPEDAYKMLAEGSGVMFPMLSGALASIAASYPDQINDIGMFAQPGIQLSQMVLLYGSRMLIISTKMPKIWMQQRNGLNFLYQRRGSNICKSRETFRSLCCKRC